MKVLIIDNYDSFTFNLFQYCGEILDKKVSSENQIIVKRNNQICLNDLKLNKPDKIIISPGPGSPEQKKYFGICQEIILKFGPKIPILGICLGMQGIVHSFGGKIIHANEPMHGKTSFLLHDQKGIHQKIPQNIEIMRYHSLIVDTKSLPSCFVINGVSQNIDNKSSILDINKISFRGEIMAISHKLYPIYGIQYHPESFGSEGGKEILENFLFNL
jgi:anthranilate synthase component 2